MVDINCDKLLISVENGAAWAGFTVLGLFRRHFGVGEGTYSEGVSAAAETPMKTVSSRRAIGLAEAADDRGRFWVNSESR